MYIINTTVEVKINFKNMTRYYKVVNISKKLNRPFIEVAKEMYLEKEMCGKEISEELKKITGIDLGLRSIERELSKIGVIRTRSEAYNLAIRKGRKSYDHLRKEAKSKEQRKGIMPKLRYKIMQRDGFKCVLCGRNQKDDGAKLVLDHIIPVVSEGKNEESNLRTLCQECNTGKMLLEEKHL